MLLVWFQDLKWTWSKYLKRCLQTKHWSIWTLDRIRDSGKFSEPTYNVLEACYFLTFGFVHIMLEKSENSVFTLKTHQMFSVHTTCRRNLKALFALWKRTKCFLSTLRRRNWKRNNHHWVNLKALFALWKRTKCFLSTLRRRNLKSQQSPVILDLWLRQGNHVITVTSSFLKSSVLLKYFPSTVKR